MADAPSSHNSTAPAPDAGYEVDGAGNPPFYPLILDK
jgi:hypothetical protein